MPDGSGASEFYTCMPCISMSYSLDWPPPLKRLIPTLPIRWTDSIRTSLFLCSRSSNLWGPRLLGFGVFVFRFLGVGDSYIYNTYLSVEDTRTLLAQRRKLHDLFPRMSLTRFPECRREFHVSQGPIRFGLYGFARGLRL